MTNRYTGANHSGAVFRYRDIAPMWLARVDAPLSALTAKEMPQKQAPRIQMPSASAAATKASVKLVACEGVYVTVDGPPGNPI